MQVKSGVNIRKDYCRYLILVSNLRNRRTVLLPSDLLLIRDKLTSVAIDDNCLASKGFLSQRPDRENSCFSGSEYSVRPNQRRNPLSSRLRWIHWRSSSVLSWFGSFEGYGSRYMIRFFLVILAWFFDKFISILWKEVLSRNKKDIRGVRRKSEEEEKKEKN